MRSCRWILVLTFLAWSISLAHGGAARIGGDPTRDVRQTMQARKLLADDPDLAAWNIGVTVRDRVATLWGPVPSAEIAFRAELCLKTMIELAEVRNDLFLSEYVKPMRVPLKIDNAPSPVPDRMPPALPRIPRSSSPQSIHSPAEDEFDPLRPRIFNNLRATVSP